MHTYAIISAASILASVTAGPLPESNNLADQQDMVFRRASASGTGASTAPSSTGTASAGDVDVRQKVTGHAAVDSVKDNDGSGAGKDEYKMYHGSGSASDGWPSLDDWVSYSNMWKDNADYMKTSCTEYKVKDNSDEEISDIEAAIEDVAKATKVDHRFILAVMMQESKGCSRIPLRNTAPPIRA